MPRYTDSTIWESYVALAAEKGLISKGEKSPRHDARTNKEIADLHGIKPEMTKGMEYDKNIAEVGREDPVVFFNAHDKMNGLVENINERHNIMVNIVNKRNHGHLNTKKLANNDLIKSLIKVANDLDNRDAEELRILADACIADLQKQAGIWDTIKDFVGTDGGNITDTAKGLGGGALIGSIIGGIIGGFGGTAVLPGAGTLAGVWAGAQAGGAIGALVGGSTAAIAKTSPHATSVANNAQITINQLADLIKKFPTIELLNVLNKELMKLKVFAEQYAQISGNPNVKVNSTESVESFVKGYINQMNNIKPVIQLFRTKAEQGDFAQSESSGWSKIKTPLYWFMDDDVEDVTDALNVLEEEIAKAKEGMGPVKESTKAVVDHAISEGTDDKASTPEEMLASLKSKYFPGSQKA